MGIYAFDWDAVSVDISGERLRGSEQFRADGDSSEGEPRQGADLHTEQLLAPCDRLRWKLSSREAT